MSPFHSTRLRPAQRRGSPTSAAAPGHSVSRWTGRSTATRPLLRTAEPDLGATTVEYAMVVLAAAAFGGVMAAVLSSGQVRELLTAIITRSLAV